MKNINEAIEQKLSIAGIPFIAGREEFDNAEAAAKYIAENRDETQEEIKAILEELPDGWHDESGFDFCARVIKEGGSYTITLK